MPDVCCIFCNFLLCQNCAGKAKVADAPFTLSATLRGVHKLTEAAGPQEAKRVFFNLSQLEKLDYIGSDELWLVAGKREKRILPYLLGGDERGPLVSKEFIAELRLVEGTPLRIENRGAMERQRISGPVRIDYWVVAQTRCRFILERRPKSPEGLPSPGLRTQSFVGI